MRRGDDLVPESFGEGWALLPALAERRRSGGRQRRGGLRKAPPRGAGRGPAIPWRRASIAVTLAALVGGGAAHGTDPPAAVVVDLAAERAALADAERAFSRLSRQQGMRAAFLAFLAADAVIFRPGPVAGRPFVEARPSPPIELTWRPLYVEVAAAGDLGFTTGPYEIRDANPADRSPKQRGYYVTVWRKQADGSWKVAADVGVDTPPPAGTEADEGAAPRHGRIAAGAPARQAPAGAADPRAATERALLATDQAFAGDATAHGPRAAYLQVIADDVRFYRSGALPAVGREATAQALAGQPQRPVTWEPTAAAVSSGGDLGYTYGNYAVMGAGLPVKIHENGIYFRIWERQGDGKYKVVVDLAKALPRPAPLDPADSGGPALRPVRPAASPAPPAAPTPEPAPVPAGPAPGPATSPPAAGTPPPAAPAAAPPPG